MTHLFTRMSRSLTPRRIVAFRSSGMWCSRMWCLMTIHLTLSLNHESSNYDYQTLWWLLLSNTASSNASSLNSRCMRPLLYYHYYYYYYYYYNYTDTTVTAATTRAREAAARRAEGAKNKGEKSESHRKPWGTPSPPIKSLDFRGFDSSKLLVLRGGNYHIHRIW